MCHCSKPFRFLSAMCLLLAMSIVMAAQVTTGDINGTVEDGSGKVVPGATVTVTNTATNRSRSTVSNDSGDFGVTSLPPGTYTVTVEAQGFSKSVTKDVELGVGNTRTLKIEMKAGQITETVEVVAQDTLVETSRSDIDTSVSPKEIEGLPIINRTFSNLTIVAPEARPVGNFDPTKTRIGTVAFNGGDGRGVNVNVDGGDNKDNVVGSLLQNFAYESIQEFQVLQHRWTAEQGRAVGGIVNVITKSGGNQFRGSVFGNFRHQSMITRDFFDKQALRDNPQYNRQEYGGSIGGPIIKDKLFFFGAIERFRERTQTPIFNGAVAALRAIPGVQYVDFIPNPYNDTLFTAKIDHKINTKQSMFYRYSFQDNSSPNDQVANPARTDLSGGNESTNRLHSLAINHTFQVKSNLVNVFTYHFQDFVNEILPNPTGIGLALNFPNGISIGQNANTPQSTKERKNQFRNDTTWIKGDHTLKFGTNYINTTMDGYFYFGVRGYSLTFNTPADQIMATGGFNQPGLLQSLTYSDGASSHFQKLHQLAFYVQDDWKATRKLTLNLGLRWDANIGNLPAQDQNRTMLILKNVNHPIARGLTTDQEALTRTTPSWTEFQPRIGFAYDPTGDGKTVIRGGYGIFYDQIFQNLSLFSAVQSQPAIFQTAINLQAPDPVLAAFRYGTTPLPTVPANADYSNLFTGSVGRINDPTATEPYIQKFTLGFQHEFGKNWSVSADYVHTLGLFEPRFRNMNPLNSKVCDPRFGGNSTVRPECPSGITSRILSPAFVAAGLPSNRLAQILMFSTNNRSLFDSFTTTLKYRSRKYVLNFAHVLASSRAWGGQPTASYSGTGIAILDEEQFQPNEFGPTRLDERHRIVMSGVLNLPYGFQIAPVMQFATARPFSPILGYDVNGDGLLAIDRLCAGVSPLAVFQVRTNIAAVQALNPRGCTQAKVNSQRKGFVIVNGTAEERSGNFFNTDVRVTKNFRFGERFNLATFIDLFNVFDSTNLSWNGRTGFTATPGSATSTFMLPQSLFGPGFGPPIGRPFTAQLGARFTF